DLRAVLRLAAFGAPDLWTDSVVHRVVHELGRSEHVHRGGRHRLRAGIRRRAPATGLQPVPLGRCSDDGAADPGNVCRKIRVPLPRRDRARMLFRRADHDGLAWHDQRPREEPDPGARLYRYLRGREYAADDLGNGAGHADDIAAAPSMLTSMEQFLVRSSELALLAAIAAG